MNPQPTRDATGISSPWEFREYTTGLSTLRYLTWEGHIMVSREEWIQALCFGTRLGKYERIEMAQIESYKHDNPPPPFL